MAFSDKLKDFVDQSIKISKDAAKQVGDKAQQWGEMGVIKIEISSLKNQIAKLTAKLGAEVFDTFVKKGQKTISKDTINIKDLIDQIDVLEKQIAEKEEAFKVAGGKDSDFEKEEVRSSENEE